MALRLFRCGCCYEDELDAWRATPSSAGRELAGRARISRPKSIGSCWCPTAAARCRTGGGRFGQAPGRACRCGTRRGLAERLPARRFRLAQTWSSGAEATQLRSGIRLRGVPVRALPARSRPERVGDPRAASRMRIMRFAALASRGSRRWRATGSTRPRRTLGPDADWRRPPATSARFATGQRLPGVGGRGAAQRRIFPAIHAVGRASAEAPRLIELRWSPPQADANLPRLDPRRQGRVLRQRRPGHQAERRAWR